MNENIEEQGHAKENIDLSGLETLSFGPSWGEQKAEKISITKAAPDRSVRRGRRQDFRPRSDRFNGKPDSKKEFNPSFKQSENRPRNKEQGEQQNRDRRPNNKRRFDNSHRPNKPFFYKTAEISIYPEDKPFTVLAKAIKSSARTYELFEIAGIILEKPERFVISMKLKPGKGGEEKPLYICPQDNIPFSEENDAMAYSFTNYKDKFFTKETIEIEAPKGNFTMISRCGFTGELLAPPNYHAYQQILRDHHATHFPKMAFEKFLSHIETLKEPEQIEKWLEQMKNVSRYTLIGDNTVVFDGEGAAKAYLFANKKDLLVKKVSTARFSGKLIEKMPLGQLKSEIELEVEKQREFPLTTANGLRGRLRRFGFILYKKRNSGITVVSAIKRKYRTPSSVFSDTIQRIFNFLDKHPNTIVSEMPRLMLGIDELKTPETETTAPSIENTSTEEIQKTEPGVTEATESTENTNPTPGIDDETTIKNLLSSIHWLVSEGYVAESSKGELSLHPIMTEAQIKSAEKEEKTTEDNIAESIPQVNVDKIDVQTIDPSDTATLEAITDAAPIVKTTEEEKDSTSTTA